MRSYFLYLLEADYDNGTTVYNYSFDVAGNLMNMNGTTRVYNAANQMTHDGTNTLTFDDNGNMTSDGVNSYTWDRANRLLSHAGTSYAYDGNSNRILQTVSSVITEYLVDTQPALSKVLRESDGTNTTHFVHAPRGIHAQYDGTDWTYTAQDALGSVRAAFDDTAAIQQSVNYSPVGVPDSAYDGFAFTGEQRDSNGLQYHRARYYDAGMGVWASLDPLETRNRYGYVGGNPVNMVDPTGLFDWDSLRIDQGDTLSCIAAEGGIPFSKFQEFVSMVQLLNNSYYPDLPQNLSPMPPESSFCSSIGGSDLIDPQPVIYPNRICLGVRILIPDAIPSVSNILHTGKQNSGRYCPGRSPVKQCPGTPEPPPPILGQTSEMISLQGQRYFLDASYISIIQRQYENDFGIEANQTFSNLTLNLEWHQALNSSGNKGWYVNVAFVVAPTDFFGGSVGYGRVWGSIAKWPQKGDISVSRSYSVDFAILTIEDSIGINGDFIRFEGVTGSADVFPFDDYLPLLSGSNGAGVSLYLGEGSSDLLTAFSLLLERDNWQKFTQMVNLSH